jgi:hypothetical protein
MPLTIASLPFYGSWKLNSATVTYVGLKREAKYFAGVKFHLQNIYTANDHSIPFSGTNIPEFEPPEPCKIDKYRIQ